MSIDVRVKNIVEYCKELESKDLQEIEWFLLNFINLKTTNNCFGEFIINIKDFHISYIDFKNRSRISKSK